MTEIPGSHRCVRLGAQVIGRPDAAEGNAVTIRLRRETGRFRLSVAGRADPGWPLLHQASRRLHGASPEDVTVFPAKGKSVLQVATAADLAGRSFKLRRTIAASEQFFGARLHLSRASRCHSAVSERIRHAHRAEYARRHCYREVRIGRAAPSATILSDEPNRLRGGVHLPALAALCDFINTSGRRPEDQHTGVRRWLEHYRDLAEPSNKLYSAQRMTPMTLTTAASTAPVVSSRTRRAAPAAIGSFDSAFEVIAAQEGSAVLDVPRASRVHYALAAVYVFSPYYVGLRELLVHNLKEQQPEAVPSTEPEIAPSKRPRSLS